MAEGEKVCPFCAETIKAAAIVCRYCGRDLPGPQSIPEPETLAVLDAEIERRQRMGYRLVSRDGPRAQMVKPKEFSFWAALLWFLFFGIGIVIYLIYYASKKDELIVLDAGELEAHRARFAEEIKRTRGEDLTDEQLAQRVRNQSISLAVAGAVFLIGLAGSFLRLEISVLIAGAAFLWLLMSGNDYLASRREATRRRKLTSSESQP